MPMRKHRHTARVSDLDVSHYELRRRSILVENLNITGMGTH